ncbi:MAG: hypothetical protein JWN83_1874 [Chitinophagaceae bacterium]|nr:hypothetical protein [Chitinophagaceae bacterium]
MRLAIISSHPVQYNAPFFKALNMHSNLIVKVFYTWSQASKEVYDPGFKQLRLWDIPLLDGYEYEFIKNISYAPGSHHFFGIINIHLIKKIKAWNPDYILVYGWAFLSHLLAIKYFYNKIPILFRGDSTLLDETKGIKTILRRKFLKWVYKSIDIALYVGSNNYDYYFKHNVPVEKLKYLPHVVDNKRFQNPIANHNLQLENLKINTLKKIVFLFVGKFEKKKDPLIIIEAFIKLGRDDTALIFIGDGELYSELREHSKSIANIYFLPFQNQSLIAGAYKLGDVLILPSKYNETWGLVVNEAMASGLAIITSNKVGCGNDLVKEDINGFTFLCGDVNGLSSKMRLLCMHQVLKKMKENSLKIIEAFSITKNATDLEIILNKFHTAS